MGGNVRVESERDYKGISFIIQLTAFSHIIEQNLVLREQDIIIAQERE